MGFFDYVILLAVAALIVIIAVNYFRHRSDGDDVHCGSCPYKKYCPDPKGKYEGRKNEQEDA